MKKMKYAVVLFLLFAQTNLCAAQIDTADLLEKVSQLEPIFSEIELPETVSYDHLFASIEQLVDAYEYITYLYNIDSTATLEAQLEAITITLLHIQAYVEELTQPRTFLMRPYQQPIQTPHTQPTAVGQQQQLINQVHQQQLINSLIDQSNYAMDSLNRPNRWRNFKIAAYLIVGTVVTLSIAAVAFIAYKKISAFINTPTVTIDDQLERAENIGETIKKDVSYIETQLQPVAKNTQEIKDSIKEIQDQAEGLLDDHARLLQKANDKKTILGLILGLKQLWQQGNTELKAQGTKIEGLQGDLACLRTRHNRLARNLFELNRQSRKRDQQQDERLKNHSKKFSALAKYNLEMKYCSSPRKGDKARDKKRKVRRTCSIFGIDMPKK